MGILVLRCRVIVLSVWIAAADAGGPRRGTVSVLRRSRYRGLRLAIRGDRRAFGRSVWFRRLLRQ